MPSRVDAHISLSIEIPSSLTAHQSSSVMVSAERGISIFFSSADTRLRMIWQPYVYASDGWLAKSWRGVAENVLRSSSYSNDQALSPASPTLQAVLANLHLLITTRPALMRSGILVEGTTPIRSCPNALRKSSIALCLDWNVFTFESCGSQIFPMW